MTTPLILTAFGTTSSAQATYVKIENEIQKLLPTLQIYWSFSSRIVTAQLKKEQNITIKTIPDLLNECKEHGQSKALVQSLHLFPGHEFHKLCHQVSQSTMSCGIGNPLLTLPQDYLQLTQLIAPIIHSMSDQTAILVMGHGTDHPSWTSYYALQEHLHNFFGDHVFVGVVEKYPNCDHLIKNIVEKGFKHVYMIPLFLVAGLHYSRDMIGAALSWKTRLEEHGIIVDSYSHGIGMLPGIESLICEHIHTAAKTIGVPL